MAGEVWRRKDDVAFVDSGPERSAVLDLDRLDQPPYILNGSSAVIWQLVDGRRDRDAIVAAVAEFYEVEPMTVEQAVAEFLADLEGRGLVVQA